MGEVVACETPFVNEKEEVMKVEKKNENAVVSVGVTAHSDNDDASIQSQSTFTSSGNVQRSTTTITTPHKSRPCFVEMSFEPRASAGP